MLQLRIGELLLLQQDLGEPAVGLIALDDEGSRRERPFLHLDRRGRAADLDPLHAQDVHDKGRARHVGLVARDDIGVRRLGAAGLDGVEALLVEVLEDLLGEGARSVWSAVRRRRLHVVGVVAHRPFHRLVRRIGAEPFALGLVHRVKVLAGPVDRLDVAQLGGGAAVAEGLVEAHQPVVVGRHEGDVAGRPGVDVAEVPDARHAELGQLRHLEVREPGQLAVEDRVEVWVLRRLTAEDVQERHRLVQIVHDRRVPFQIQFEQIPRAVAAVIDVAVVVVEDVFSPVRRARARDRGRRCRRSCSRSTSRCSGRGRRGRSPGLMATITLSRILLDQRAVLGHQAVGQLHQHLGRAGLAAVQAAKRHVDRLGLRDRSCAPPPP